MYINIGTQLWLLLIESFFVHASVFGTSSRYPLDGAESLKQKLDEIVPKNCQAMHVNILARHGTRYPTSETNSFKEVLKVLQLTRAMSQKVPPNWIESFAHIADEKRRGALGVQGQKEMYDLGNRIGSFWPRLREKSRNDWKQILVESSSMERTQQSTYFLSFGLVGLAKDSGFGNYRHPSSSFDSSLIQNLTAKGMMFRVLEPRNRLLNFFKHCQKLVKYFGWQSFCYILL